MTVFSGERLHEEFTALRAADLKERIQQFVSEERNPRNELGITAVEVCLPAPMLTKGVVLIDTLGIGSTLRHNTTTALDFLPQCDVALSSPSIHR